MTTITRKARPVVTIQLRTAYIAYTAFYALDPDNLQYMQLFKDMLDLQSENFCNMDIKPYTYLSHSQLKFVVDSLQNNTYKVVQSMENCKTVLQYPTMLLNNMSDYWNIAKFIDNRIDQFAGYFKEFYDTVWINPSIVSITDFKYKINDYYKNNYDLIWQDRNLPLSEIIEKIK